MSLFGGSTQTPFGSSASQNKPSLFGSSTNQNTQQSGGLFGSSTNQQSNTGTGLFGGGSSFMGASQQPQGTGLFASQQKEQPPGNLFGSARQTVFGSSLPPPTAPVSLNASSSVWQPPPPAHQKTVPDQMADLLAKWSPDSGTTVFQNYFYNQVDPRTVPYYVAPADEDPKAWEEALSKKPNEGAIPVLGRGFRSVAGRLETQAKAVEALQLRLHEMNDSLTQMLQQHDLIISVRATDAKRRHIALTQRCLALATKSQILRNRGYAMDAREEQLRKTLLQLEKKAFDPMLNGRQEEIWARMSGVRQRAKLLQAELQKMGNGTGSADNEELDEENLKSIKKVLGDFDSQLTHLKKELDEITKEFTEWKDGPEPGAHGR
ncbi:uncharacterized protein K452DRAFT_355425 [Aplosporella prunicola CBS 121167]|uniref:Nucleoporin Nup54 alpha-helical domain-containing protein n=1 Tax=Aplosporella prunicola CBS 121167 TaxID=1176127 RepID=A0A6A6BTH8_9PEZI|nr:uncharacterized protein K452DRAFT_355425 [Aplosporella prunicola CBS 121167]KAF2145921.1 hypothetical protein K452DRAFT_355425 [Aplosporella prunicola CBS 121167]